MSVSVDGDAAKDCALNFIQRWNHHTVEMDVMPILTPHRASKVGAGMTPSRVDAHILTYIHTFMAFRWGRYTIFAYMLGLHSRPYTLSR